jgi:hypothetical protein
MCRGYKKGWLHCKTKNKNTSVQVDHDINTTVVCFSRYSLNPDEEAYNPIYGCDQTIQYAANSSTAAGAGACGRGELG